MPKDETSMKINLISHLLCQKTKRAYEIQPNIAFAIPKDQKSVDGETETLQDQRTAAISHPKAIPLP